MAYSSYGKKVYASIKDLPQYTSIGNGDKIIIWNETRDGAATVDFADLLIDLEHCTFKSTISEIITLASDIETFVNTVEEEITGIQKALTSVEDTINNELRCRIKALEFIVAVILGGNSYWLSSAGLDNLRNKFIIEGIAASDSDIISSAETDEEKNNLKWYTGLITTIKNYVNKMSADADADDILLQTKFRYKFSDIPEVAPVTTATPLSSKTTITTTSYTGGGDNRVESGSTETTISYN